MIQLAIQAFITFHWIDAVDIVLVAVLIYQLYYMIKGTVAINIFIGILLFYLLWLSVVLIKFICFCAS